jgi:hypothetical protein
MDDQFGELPLEPTLDLVAELPQAVRSCHGLLPPKLERFPHPLGERHGLGAGAHPSLLSAPEEDGVRPNRMPEHENSDPRRPMEFVCGDGHGVDPQASEIDLDLAGALDSVRMHWHPLFPA